MLKAPVSIERRRAKSSRHGLDNSGHIHLSDFEAFAPTGWTEALSLQPRGVRITTAPYRLAAAAAQQVDADDVIFDIGPNVGALNRAILLGCDGFIVPLAPDLFSLNALPSVGKSMAGWIRQWARIRSEVSEESLGFALPKGEPSPLGYISQQFAIYRSAPAGAYRRWLAQIPSAYRSGIVEPLEAVGIRVPHGDHQIGEVSNLSSLVPIAQQSNAAVFELSGSEARGAHYTKAKDTLDNLRRSALPSPVGAGAAR